jgi:hypothetical protein
MSIRYTLLLVQRGHTGHHRLVGAGLQPCGCQSLVVSACFQGESFGSFLVFFRGCVAGASSATGTGGSRGISWAISGSSTTGCGFASCSPKVRGGSARSLISWSLFVCPTPLSGSLDFNICIGCCLSGASSAEGFEAQRASACDASIFIRSCRMRSWCCSVMVGGSKRVWRSHCIHDAATCQRVSVAMGPGTHAICRHRCTGFSGCTWLCGGFAVRAAGP